MLDFLVNRGPDVVEAVAYLVLALAVVARLVAPMTKTTLDDRAANALTRFYALIVRVLAGKKALPELPGAE